MTPKLLEYGETGGPTKDATADAIVVDQFDLLLLADDGPYWFWRPTYTRKRNNKGYIYIYIYIYIYVYFILTWYTVIL